jgi:hypothetical protein
MAFIDDDRANATAAPVSPNLFILIETLYRALANKVITRILPACEFLANPVLRREVSRHKKPRLHPQRGRLSTGVADPRGMKLVSSIQPRTELTEGHG